MRASASQQWRIRVWAYLVAGIKPPKGFAATKGKGSRDGDVPKRAGACKRHVPIRVSGGLNRLI